MFDSGAYTAAHLARLPAAVVCATPTDIAAVASLAATYMAGQPVIDWLIAGAERREHILRWLATILVTHALGHGYVDLIAGRSAAIWLDRTTDLPRPANLNDGTATEKVLQRLAVLAAHQPDVEHLDLAVLVATDDADAAALLAHRHRGLDRAAVPAFAQAADPAAIRRLSAAGYQPGDPYRLDGGPWVQPMLRTPTADLERRQLWPPGFN
ncbi:hypothetical protein ACFY36_50515 [Actinoplanes sp. NPDC000266]